MVDSIFDRLNRGGENLNSTELRKAKYYDSIMHKQIVDIANSEIVSKTLDFLDKIRMQNVEFVTEIFLLVLLKKNVSGEADKIDRLFKANVDDVNIVKADIIKEKVIRTFEIFNSFELDLVGYSIMGTSHLYALLYVAYCMEENGVLVDEKFKEKLNGFYKTLRAKGKNELVLIYSESMQSQTKSISARKMRVNALCDYLQIDNSFLI